MGDPLVTLEQAKAFGASGDDALIQIRIESVTEAFEDYCARHLRHGDQVERIPGSGTQRLCLKRWPIDTVTEVRVDGVVVTDFTVEDAALGILFREEGWPRTYPRWADLTGDPVTWAPEINLQVTYKGGLVRVPARLVEACCNELVRRQARPPGAGDDLVEERTAGGWAQKWASPSKDSAGRPDFMPETFSALSKYQAVKYA